jgi:hypothetical protein
VYQPDADVRSDRYGPLEQQQMSVGVEDSDNGADPAGSNEVSSGSAADVFRMQSCIHKHRRITQHPLPFEHQLYRDQPVQSTMSQFRRPRIL